MVSMLLIFSNGKKLEKTNFNLMEPYSSNTKIKILKVLENPKLNIKNSKFLKELEKQITIEHETITKKIMKFQHSTKISWVSWTNNLS